MSATALLFEKLLSSGYDSVKSEILISQILNNVGKCVSGFYTMIDGAWGCSAYQSIIEYYGRLKNPEEKHIQLIKALTYIEQAHSMAWQRICNPKVKTSIILFGHTVGHRDTTIVHEDEELSLRTHAIELAVLQSLPYNELDSELADEWKIRAINEFNEYADLKINFTPYQLEKINPAYVYEDSFTTSALVEYSDIRKGFEERTETSKEISSEGWNFIHQKRNTLKKQFTDNFAKLSLSSDFKSCMFGNTD